MFRTALKFITVGPLFMAGGILLGACSGANTGEPVHPTERNASGITAYCVSESHDLTRRLGFEDWWNKTDAEQECASRGFRTRGEVDVFLGTLEEIITAP